MAKLNKESKLVLAKSEKEIFIKAITAAYQVGRADGNFIHNFTPQLMKGQAACIKQILDDFISIDK